MSVDEGREKREKNCKPKSLWSLMIGGMNVDRMEEEDEEDEEEGRERGRRTYTTKVESQTRFGFRCDEKRTPNSKSPWRPTQF
jgi:hypothetical protein